MDDRNDAPVVPTDPETAADALTPGPTAPGAADAGTAYPSRVTDADAAAVAVANPRAIALIISQQARRIDELEREVAQLSAALADAGGNQAGGPRCPADDLS